MNAYETTNDGGGGGGGGDGSNQKIKRKTNLPEYDISNKPMQL